MNEIEQVGRVEAGQESSGSQPGGAAGDAGVDVIAQEGADGRPEERVLCRSPRRQRTRPCHRRCTGRDEAPVPRGGCGERGADVEHDAPRPDEGQAAGERERVAQPGVRRRDQALQQFLRFSESEGVSGHVVSRLLNSYANQLALSGGEITDQLVTALEGEFRGVLHPATHSTLAKWMRSRVKR